MDAGSPDTHRIFQSTGTLLSVPMFRCRFVASEIVSVYDDRGWNCGRKYFPPDQEKVAPAQARVPSGRDLDGRAAVGTRQLQQRRRNESASDRGSLRPTQHAAWHE